MSHTVDSKIVLVFACVLAGMAGVAEEAKFNVVLDGVRNASR